MNTKLNITLKKLSNIETKVLMSLYGMILTTKRVLL